MIWISAEDVILIHSRVIEGSGGLDGLRDRDGLEAAVSAPMQTFDGSLDTLVRVANALNVSTDDLLVDSLTNTIKVSNHEFADILADCSDYELRVLLDMVKAAKQALREYKHLLRSSRG